MSRRQALLKAQYHNRLKLKQATAIELARIAKKYPAYHVALNDHINTRGVQMDFNQADYLLRLYKRIEKDTHQVVIKAVQCFPPSTPIMTDTGFKDIQDVVVGDRVLTHEGRFREVTAVGRRYVSEKLNLLRSDVGEPILSTQEHPFRVYKYGNSRKYHYSRFKEVFTDANLSWCANRDICVGDFVLRANYPVTGTLREIYLSDYIDVYERKGDRFIRGRNSTGFQNDRVVLDLDFGKLIGYYIAEGWVSYTRLGFGFHNDEIEYIRDIQNILSKFVGIKKISTYITAKDTCTRVKVCSKEWGQFLKRNCGSTVDTKQLPEFVFKGPEEFLKGLLLGLFNGDGFYHASQTTYTTVSRVLSLQVQILLSMFNISSVVRSEHYYKEKRRVYKVVVSGADNTRLLKLMGSDVQATSRYTRSISLGNHRACRVKEHVQQDYSGYVYNLSVADDESYVASGYVVHNCGLSELYIIQSHIEAGKLGMTVMYVLPKYEIRNRFVNNRIYKLHKKVDLYARMVEEADTRVHRTALMHFGKGTLAYVGSNVEDEFIEIPIDSAYVDELDRCDLSNLLMLPDRLTASPYGYQREISNPTVEGFGIDERYNDSSKGVWMLKCPRCNQWFTPDFYKHVVRQVGDNRYVPRDPDYVPGESLDDARLIHDCGGVVDRLADGEWVHEFPRKLWKGYRISKIFTKFTPLSALIEKHEKALGNDRKMQVFMNSDLGLAYSSEGAKISDNMLTRCKRDYAYPVMKSDKHNARFVGVDVGTVLHIIIRERIRVENGYAFRLVLATHVPGFNQLAQLLREWRPKYCVIDAMPEIHKVAELKSEFKYVWSSRFQDSIAELSKRRDIRELRMDRTALLDEVKQGFELERLWIPQNGEFIDNGDYFAHLKSSTRVLEANEKNPEKSRYVWKHSQPDHFFLAESYCLQASLLSPNESIWDFYTESSQFMDVERAEATVPGAGDNKLELAKQTDMTPELFLMRTQEQHNKETKVKPDVDVEKIKRMCEYTYKAQGYVDIDILCDSLQEHEDDVRRVLLQLGFEESHIRGQYIK